MPPVTDAITCRFTSRVHSLFVGLDITPDEFFNEEKEYKSGGQRREYVGVVVTIQFVLIPGLMLR